MWSGCSWPGCSPGSSAWSPAWRPWCPTRRCSRSGCRRWPPTSPTRRRWCSSGSGRRPGSRPELAGQRPRLIRFGLLNAVGGAAGAGLLLLTPASAFEAVVPVLIAGASVVLLLGPRLRGGPGDRESSPVLQAAVLAVAVYTGYFGAAGGVLVLAVLTALLDLPLARTIAIKNVISSVANAVAALAFALFGPVDWRAVAPLALGFLAGGWLGPGLVRRLPAGPLRVFIGLCGLGIAVKLGLDTYA
ncbi:MAG TPA: sulfite exporter TauE/SafE family protein [Mycobacteriales bacterium]|nr:sulfite exporter TauE/SafE family protein [Mycobacteriales bacterium]